MVLVLAPVWRPRNLECSCLMAKEEWCVSSRKNSKFSLPLPFCCIQAFEGLDDSHLHWGRWSLLNLPIQMLLSSAKAFCKCPQTHPELMFYQLSVQPLAWSSDSITLSLIKNLHSVQQFMTLVAIRLVVALGAVIHSPRSFPSCASASLLAGESPRRIVHKRF